MEGQPPNPIRDLGEQISNAISNAVSITVEQGLQDVSLTNQAVLAFSAMSRTIGQTGCSYQKFYRRTRAQTDRYGRHGTA